MSPKWRFFLATVLAVVALDQATKAYAYLSIAYMSGRVTVIPGLFDLVHRQNPGATMGLLADSPHRLLVFYAFTAVAVVLAVGFQWVLDPPERFVSAMSGMILGGALGNLIDRVHKGTVTDLLRFYTDDPDRVAWLHRHGLPAEYPTFNVADASLVVGVLLFVALYPFSGARADED